MLSLATIPKDILATNFYLSTRVNRRQAKNAGLFEGSLVEYAIDWDIVRQEIAGTKRPSAIDGQSWYGLNSGAKQSVDKNYLAMAEATGRVQVLPLHVAVDISESKSQGLYYVFANEIGTNGQTLKQHVFATQHLFLAAGSTGTSALLVRARDKGTLPRLNKWVGQDWGINGDFVVVRGGLPDNNPGTGGPCGHILMEDLYNPFSVSNMVELVIPKNVRDSFPRSSLYVGLGLAPALGVCTYDPATDAVTFDWPFQDSRLESFSQGAASMLQTLNEANPGSFTAFFSEDPAQSSTAFTAHPVGGAVIGKVCDQFGRVHGHRGLYVVDGALVSRGVGRRGESGVHHCRAGRTMRGEDHRQGY